jgi:hypothetical protein
MGLSGGGASQTNVYRPEYLRDAIPWGVITVVARETWGGGGMGGGLGVGWERAGLCVAGAWGKCGA